jgi:glutamate-1-semialdehyde 2,1-aminomutase
MNFTNSKHLYETACNIIPGGVNSPVRAFTGVGGSPVFFKKGDGAYLIDVDDNKYVDYVGSWGPLILGHADPEVLHAVSEVMQHGMTFGAPTVLEITMTQTIQHCMPNLEKIRMVNSGTEATMTAIRLARGFTKRQKIIKFSGCYHGHNDALLVKAGSGALTMGVPSSPGIPEVISNHTIVAEYNDLEMLQEVFLAFPEDIAAVIVEPIAGNMGMVLPSEGFLVGLRELCNKYGTVLIFDEVMTGFRVALGGAQSIFNVKPDLTTLGKIIGGGLPVGAIGGKTEIMDMLAPIGPVYQAGTLSGNPMAMAAGIATLRKLQQPDLYATLLKHAEQLVSLIKNIANSYDIPCQTTALGGMFGFAFTATKPIKNLSDISSANLNFFKKFFHAMLKQGIYFAPSMYEAGFISIKHNQETLGLTERALQEVFKTIGE